MENATKALMIAAAILVAILVISLGIGIFNSASEQAEGAGDLSEYEVQTFNDKFTKYNGTNVSGSDVNAMLKTVFNHNQVQEDETTQVTVTKDATRSTATEAKKAEGIHVVLKMNTAPDKVSTGSRYTVKCIYNAKSKLVEHIQLTENKTTT